MQFFLEAGYKLLQTVEVDAENEKIQKNQFVFKATYGVAQKRLISKRQKKKGKKIITRRKSIVVFCSLVSQIYSGVVVATGRRVTLGTTFSTTKE